jgi:AhpD family alkylhydroperoxidase
MYETALIASGRLDTHLKQLAELKAASLVNCEYCLDIGSALASASGIREKQLSELPRFRTSEDFDSDEKLVLELAESITRTPAVVPDVLRERLLERWSETQVVELATTVAWENYRGRLNVALGVQSSGFSDGAVCAVPER